MDALANAISPDTVAEWVFYTVLWIATAFIVAKIYSHVQKQKLEEEYRLKHADVDDAERNALKLMMRDRLCDLLEKYRNRGCVSETEFEDATEHYDTYKALWGNSFGDSYFEEIKDLHRNKKRG